MSYELGTTQSQHVSRCHCVALYDLMLFAAVDELSDDGPAEPEPKQRKVRTRKIRRSKPKADLNHVQNLIKDQQLLSQKLSKKCGCAAGTCTSQFLEESKLNEYIQYLTHWGSLAKLDQDQIASRLYHLLWI